jgi:hypothetical protein
MDPARSDEVLPTRILPAEDLNGVLALRGAGWKAIFGGAGVVYHDLVADHEELNPKTEHPAGPAAESARVALEQDCERVRRLIGGDELVSTPGAPDPERDHKLRALGYVE